MVKINLKYLFDLNNFFKDKSKVFRAKYFQL